MTNTLNKIIHNGDEYELPRQKALVITLTSAGWTNNEQTVTATGVTANNSIIISPAPTYISDYTDAKIYCSAQGTDSLTFTCDSTPASDIEVNVLVLSAEAGSGPTPPSPGWQPGVNTVAYYPLTSDTNDETGNYNLSPTDITYTTLSSGLSVATFNGSSSKAETSSFTTATGDYTTSMRVYGDDIQSTLAVIWGNATSDSSGRLRDVYLQSGEIRALIQPNGYLPTSNNFYQNHTWYHVVVSSSPAYISLYINNNLIVTQNLTCSVYPNMYIGYRQYNNDRYWKGYISRVIIENKARTAQEISDYYDQTKGDYGIS